MLLFLLDTPPAPALGAAMLLFLLDEPGAPVTSQTLFDEWLAASEREEFVLCEPEPLYTLTGFAAVGAGAPNSYSVPLSRFHEATRVAGGLYGKVTGVRQDDASLTARASLALVDANAGSYYWDEAAGVLYVRPTSGAPSTYTMLALVRFYFANAPVVLDHIYYHPWLTGELPHIRREAEDLLSGATSTPSGSVAFTNGHGAWFGLAAADGPWTWKNAKVRFYSGGTHHGVSLARADYKAVAVMLCEDMAPAEDVCPVALQPLTRKTELTIPVTPYFEGTYEHLGDGVRGTKKWIGYGRTVMPPDLTDTSTLGGRYTIADAAFQTLFAVHQVWAIHKQTSVSTILATDHYSVDLAACEVAIVDTYPHDEYTIAVDVTGKPDGAGSYLMTYGEIVKDMLVTFLGVPPSEIDEAAFAAADVEADPELSFWIKSPRSIASILSTAEPGFPCLSRSIMGTVQQTTEGLWTIRVWTPFTSGITSHLRREDFARFTPTPRMKTVYVGVEVHYDFDHVRQQWRIESYRDERVRHKTDSRELLPIHTYLRDANNAQALAQRYMLLAGGVPVEADFEERGARLMLHGAGDKTFITYSPAPVAAGGYTDHAFELMAVDVAFAPKLTVTGRMRDLRSLGGKPGTWMGSSAPDWASSTGPQRAASGYWTDADGRANPSDPLSAGYSMWW